MGRKEEPFVTMFHRTLCLSKATDEHGIILNYDDMQMGRRIAFLGLSVPISTHYPIVDTVPEYAKEEMRELGFTDFWNYFFNAEKVKKQMKEEEKKAKKRRWFF